MSDATALGRTPWRQRSAPLRAFIQTESGSAGILVGAVVVALVWANVDGSSYESFWGTELAFRLGDHAVTHDLREWVNSGLMTLFFLVVGLEARREFDLGQLRERSRIAIPVFAALGGLTVPVVIYLAFNPGGAGAPGRGPGGWARPPFPPPGPPRPP